MLSNTRYVCVMAYFMFLTKFLAGGGSDEYLDNDEGI